PSSVLTPTPLPTRTYTLSLHDALPIFIPAASSGIIVSIILAISRAIGETMIVAIAAGQQPRLTLDPTVPVETITAYIVQVSLGRSEEHTSELQSRENLVCRLLLETKKK